MVIDTVKINGEQNHISIKTANKENICVNERKEALPE